MSKKLLTLLSVVLLLGLFGMNSQLMAQVVGNPVDLNISVEVSSFLWIRLSVDTITFDPTGPVPTGDPPTWPLDPANENSVTVWTLAFTASGDTVTLGVLAKGPLKDTVVPTNTIPISNITWTATGAGYQAGTMNDTTSQTAGTWTGFGFRSGTFDYFYENDPQAPGTYTAIATYTLSST